MAEKEEGEKGEGTNPVIWTRKEGGEGGHSAGISTLARKKPKSEWEGGTSTNETGKVEKIMNNGRKMKRSE